MQAEAARVLIADHLGVGIGDVHDHARFAADLGADSLDMIELAMRFEEALDISVGVDESETCFRVRDALDLLDSKIAARAA